MDQNLHFGYLVKTNFYVAVKALAILAQSEDLVTSKMLNEKMAIESSFIRKVLNKLIEEDIVEGYSGRYGGYKLLANPDTLSLFDIFTAISNNAHPQKNIDLSDSIDQIFYNIANESQSIIKATWSNHYLGELIKK